MGLSLFKFVQWAPKYSSFFAPECVLAVQGRSEFARFLRHSVVGLYRLGTKHTGKTRRRNRQSGVHWSCYVLLFTNFANYWTLVCPAQCSC